MTFYTRPAGSTTVERARITSDGKVGINEDTPTTTLNVSGGFHLSGTTDQTKAQDGIILQRNSSNGNCQIIAGRAGGNYTGLEHYVAGASGVTLRHSIDYQSNHKWFGSNGSSELLRLQMGGGISFNGDSAAANALDDYEEGTFTPVLGGGSPTYSTNNTTGYYVKIGRMVHITIQIAIVVTAAGSGNFSITGLPFTSGTVAGGHGQALSVGPMYAWDYPANMIQIGPRVNDNTTLIYVWANFDSAADAYLTWPFGSSGTHYGSIAGTYVSAS